VPTIRHVGKQPLIDFVFRYIVEFNMPAGVFTHCQQLLDCLQRQLAIGEQSCDGERESALDRHVGDRSFCLFIERHHTNSPIQEVNLKLTYEIKVRVNISVQLSNMYLKLFGIKGIKKGAEAPNRIGCPAPVAVSGRTAYAGQKELRGRLGRISTQL
jgi:hypothetical protein